MTNQTINEAVEELSKDWLFAGDEPKEDDFGIHKEFKDFLRQALQAQRDAGAEEERVFVFQPQWVNEDPAWLCILTKGNEVLVEKVFTKTELSSAYRKKTGQYASTVITTYETDIGASYLLKALTPPTK